MWFRNMSSRNDSIIASTIDLNKMNSYDSSSRGRNSKSMSTNEKKSFDRSEFGFNAPSIVEEHHSNLGSRDTFKTKDICFECFSEDIDVHSRCENNREIKTTYLPERCTKISPKPMVHKPTLSDQYASKFQKMDELVSCSVVSAISKQNDCDTTIDSCLTSCEYPKFLTSELTSPVVKVDRFKMNYSCKDPRMFGFNENYCPNLNMDRSMIDAPIRKDQTTKPVESRVNLSSPKKYAQKQTNDLKERPDSHELFDFKGNYINLKREESMVNSHFGSKLETDTNDHNCECFGELYNVAMKKPANYIHVHSIKDDHDRKTSPLSVVYDDFNSLIKRRDRRSKGNVDILESGNNVNKSKSIPKSPKKEIFMTVGNSALSPTLKTFMIAGNSTRVDLICTKREEESLSSSSKLYEKIHCGINDLKEKKVTSKPFREISSTKIYAYTPNIITGAKKKRSKLPRVLSNKIY